MLLDNLVPKENARIYSLLFNLETVLRELIIQTLDEIAGPRWYKTRLPGDIKDKYINGLKYEKSIKWSRLVPHHPIYYTDFPDLKKVIEKEDNWKDAFSKIFGRKELLVATLSEVEFIRNKIAHNRICTPNDLDIFVAAHSKIIEAVGETRSQKLIERLTTVEGLYSYLRKLSTEASNSLQSCLRFEKLFGLPVWGEMSSAWWFDDSYLGSPIDGVRDYFNLLEEYGKLERGRGQGYIIEKWVGDSHLSEKFEIANNELYTILVQEG